MSHSSAAPDRASRQLVSPKGSHEIITGEKVDIVLRALLDSGRVGKVADRSGCQVELQLKSGSSVGIACNSWPQRPCVVEFEGYNSVYRVDIPADASDQHFVPTRLSRTRYRELRRAKTDPDLEIAITINTVHLSGAAQQGEVRDVSLFGFCCFVETADRRILPGEEIDVDVDFLSLTPELVEPTESNTFDPMTRTRLTMRARVCWSRQDGAGVTYWNELIDVRTHQDAWRSLVSYHLYPHTETGPSWSVNAWEALGRYREKNARDSSEYVALRKSFVDVNNTLSLNPSLGHQVLRPESQGVLSFTKLYHHCWMGHQLSSHSQLGWKERQLVKRQLYVHAIEMVLFDREAQWVAAYFNGRIRWMVEQHGGFTESYEDEYAKVYPIRLWEIRAELLKLAKLNIVGRRWRIVQDHPAHRETFLNTLASTPGPYCQVLDLTPEQFLLESTSSRFAQAGMMRERVAFYAVQDGDLVAVAVAECAATGLNIYRLFDTARFFWLGRDPQDSSAQSIWVDMMGRVNTWFLSRGKDRFLYITEDLGGETLERTGLAAVDQRLASSGLLRDCGEGFFWAISRHLVPEFLEQIWISTSRL